MPQLNIWLMKYCQLFSLTMLHDGIKVNIIKHLHHKIHATQNKLTFACVKSIAYDIVLGIVNEKAINHSA